jgi:hypothetical protein
MKSYIICAIAEESEMGDVRNECSILVGKPGREHLKDLGIVGSVILKLLTKNLVEGENLIHLLRTGTNGSLCKHGNQPLGFIKCRDFPGCLSNHQLLKGDSAPWSSSVPS